MVVYWTKLSRTENQLYNPSALFSGKCGKWMIGLSEELSSLSTSAESIWFERCSKWGGRSIPALPNMLRIISMAFGPNVASKHSLSEQFSRKASTRSLLVDDDNDETSSLCWKVSLTLERLKIRFLSHSYCLALKLLLLTVKE